MDEYDCFLQFVLNSGINIHFSRMKGKKEKDQQKTELSNMLPVSMAFEDSPWSSWTNKIYRKVLGRLQTFLCQEVSTDQSP